jgi:hypothetical protein
MRKATLLFTFFFLSVLVFGQKKRQSIAPKDLEKLAQYEDTIAFYARIAVTDSILERRLAAQDKLLPTLRAALSVQNAYSYAFDKIQNISIQYPQDGSFRIFTWQLMVTPANYQYFGFIQTNASKSIVYELHDQAKAIQRPETQILSKDKWFGALYYGIRDFKSKDGVKYLLFGFNANDTVEKIKLCEVLTLRGGQPKFGAGVFHKTERGRDITHNRLMFYHATDAVMRLNFDNDMDMIVHDHLEDIGKTNKVVGVPDGTYEAYTLEKGVWEHVKQLKTTEMDEAPTPVPTLGKKAKVVDKQNTKDFKWPDEVTKKGKN